MTVHKNPVIETMQYVGPKGFRPHPTSLNERRFLWKKLFMVPASASMRTKSERGSTSSGKQRACLRPVWPRSLVCLPRPSATGKQVPKPFLLLTWSCFQTLWAQEQTTSSAGRQRMSCVMVFFFYSSFVSVAPAYRPHLYPAPQSHAHLCRS